MKAVEFEKYMRAHQFDDLCVPEGTFIALHVDGDNFSKFTESGEFEVPYDEDFRLKLLDTAKMLHKHFNAIITYVQSDEINLILPREFEGHKRNVAKLVSKATTLATAHFNEQFDRYHFFEDLPLAHFATHVYLLPKWEQVVDYVNWRKADCEKNALNAALFWELRKVGYSPKRAARLMEGKGHLQKIGMLEHNLSITFDDYYPYHYRHGHFIFWEIYNMAYFEDEDTPLEDMNFTERRRLMIPEWNLAYSEKMQELENIHSE